MATKRGLNVEEKRKRMLDFFYEKQDFFQLKELESQCSAEKGITQQTIKDILTSLTDDGLVDTDKIGTSVYYWALPSKAIQCRVDKIKQIEADFTAETARNEELKKKLQPYERNKENEDEDAESGKNEDELRAKLQDQIGEGVEKLRKMQKELDTYKANDPEAHEKMVAQVKVSKKACNRWIENIEALKSWLKNKFRVEESVINKQFEIPSELDYIQI